MATQDPSQTVQTFGRKNGKYCDKIAVLLAVIPGNIGPWYSRLFSGRKGLVKKRLKSEISKRLLPFIIKLNLTFFSKSVFKVL